MLPCLHSCLAWCRQRHVRPSAPFHLCAEALPAPPLAADRAGSIAAGKNKADVTGVWTGLGKQVPCIPWQPFCCPSSHSGSKSPDHTNSLTGESIASRLHWLTIQPQKGFILRERGRAARVVGGFLLKQAEVAGERAGCGSCTPAGREHGSPAWWNLLVLEKQGSRPWGADRVAGLLTAGRGVGRPGLSQNGEKGLFSGTMRGLKEFCGWWVSEVTEKKPTEKDSPLQGRSEQEKMGLQTCLFLFHLTQQIWDFRILQVT